MWAVALIGLALAAAARAQQILCVEHRGKPTVVRAVRADKPMVEEDGKLVLVPRSAKTALAEVKEFLPYFVSVRNLRAQSSYMTVETESGESGAMNSRFGFLMDLESPFALKNVFFVLELQLEEGKFLFFHEVGELEARQTKHISVAMPLAYDVGAGHFTLHLFSDGGELLHSEQPARLRERALDRMVKRRIEGVQDAPLRPFVGPAPEHPPALAKKKIAGQAVVRFRISRTGAVLDPEVKSATAPEFGEAAVAAIRLWRFLPAVKQGVAQEGKAELPFEFPVLEKK